MCSARRGRLWLGGREEGVGKERELTGQEVYGPLPYRWPEFSASWVWNDGYFCPDPRKEVSSWFSCGAPFFKGMVRGSLRRYVLETGFGNFRLVSCLSAGRQGGVLQSECSFFPPFDVICIYAMVAQNL